MRLQLLPGAFVQQRGNVTYIVDTSNGFTTSRGTAQLQYDALGRLVAYNDGLHTIRYTYDEQSRIIRRQINEQVISHFCATTHSATLSQIHHYFYLDEHRPQLMTSMLVDEEYWIFYYDGHGAPLCAALSQDSLLFRQRRRCNAACAHTRQRSSGGEESGKRTSQQNSFSQPLQYTPFGRRRRSPMPSMPIGHRGRFYDDIASVLFDVDGTPLDAFTGRALSLTAAQLFKPIDPYYPIDLYQPSSGGSTGASVRTLLRRAFGTILLIECAPCAQCCRRQSSLTRFRNRYRRTMADAGSCA